MGSLTAGAANTSSVATETAMESSGRPLEEVRFLNIESGHGNFIDELF